MELQAIEHTFFDIEIEAVPDPDNSRLIKVLSVDGRRFTYHLYEPVTAEAVEFIKRCIDSLLFSDLIIERSGGELMCREAPTRLKRHG